MVGGKLIHIFVEIKHHSDADNQEYGEEIGPQKLAYQVSVYTC